MPGRQWCVPGRREVRELLIVGIGVALGHLVKDCRHGKTVGGLCREGRVERKEHSYREYDVWRCLGGSVVRLVGVRHRGRLVGSFRGVRHRGRLESPAMRGTIPPSTLLLVLPPSSVRCAKPKATGTAQNGIIIPVFFVSVVQGAVDR